VRVKLTLEYDGTPFRGWQVQADGPTVQGVLEQALRIVLREPARIVAAGRTDAGVHARGQVVAFDTTRAVDLEALRRGLTALAGPHIAVLAAEEVRGDFDPRRDARARLYAYHILNRAVPSPLWRHRAWHVRRPLDVRSMETAATLLLGEHDFSAFRDAHCDAAHPVRRVLRSVVHRDGDMVVYEIEATAFLRHMVRAIVGTLVSVGVGDLDVEGFRTVLEARDRTRAGLAAPAHGLCLVAVRYG
jgi:tRNA pseudouridine38-40 synthase